MPARTQTDEARFWSKVKLSCSDCWEWQGTRRPDGYGVFMTCRNGKRRLVRALRFAWEEDHGPIPGGMFVCHRCDNPACVRPSHLFLGTCADNLADMDAKGRRRSAPRYGQDHANAKLTNADVTAIRHQFRDGIRGLNAALAREYGVTPTTISRIVRGGSWRTIRS